MFINCSRCSSPMFPVPSLRYASNADYTADLGDVRTDCRAYHCPLCGNYIDAVILANRLRQDLERRLIEAELLKPVSVPMAA